MLGVEDKPALAAAQLAKLPRWRKVEPFVKSYLGNTLHLLGECAVLLFFTQKSAMGAFSDGLFPWKWLWGSCGQVVCYTSAGNGSVQVCALEEQSVNGAVAVRPVILPLTA
jgi:hypothetical protein